MHVCFILIEVVQFNQCNVCEGGRCETVPLYVFSVRVASPVLCLFVDMGACEGPGTANRHEGQPPLSL